MARLVVGWPLELRNGCGHRSVPLGQCLIAATPAQAQGAAPGATDRAAGDRGMGQGRGAVAVVVMAVHMVKEASHRCTPRLIEDDERVTSTTTMACGLLPHAPNPAAMDLRLAPGGLREQPGEGGGVRAVEEAATPMGHALVGQDDPSGQIVLNMPTLALLLKQLAKDHCVRRDDGSRGHNRPCHHTPPCPGLRIQRGPRVAWGSRHGKSQQPRIFRM